MSDLNLSAAHAAQLAAALRDNTRAIYATLPQYFSVADLARRWGRGRSAAIAILRDYSPDHAPSGPGRAAPVPLAVVLRIEAILRGEEDPDARPRVFRKGGS